MKRFFKQNYLLHTRLAATEVQTRINQHLRQQRRASSSLFGSSLYFRGYTSGNTFEIVRTGTRRAAPELAGNIKEENGITEVHVTAYMPPGPLLFLATLLLGVITVVIGGMAEGDRNAWEYLLLPVYAIPVVLLMTWLFSLLLHNRSRRDVRQLALIIEAKVQPVGVAIK